MTKIFNKAEEKEKRKLLRNSMPPAEVLLWKRPQGKQVAGLKFRRQYSVGPFVLDFYCAELKLAIGIDGASHEGAQAADYDAVRQGHIETFDIHFLRFTNAQIYNEMESVVETIFKTAEQRRK